MKIKPNYVTKIFLINEESKRISRGYIEYGCKSEGKECKQRFSQSTNSCLGFPALVGLKVLNVIMSCSSLYYYICL